MFARILILCAALFALAAAASGQTTTGLSLTTQSSAVAVYFNGTYGLGNDTIASLNLVDFGKTKANHLSIGERTFIDTTHGFSIYGGDIGFTPNIAPLLGKTNFPVGNFYVSFHASIGNGIPAAGPSHIAFLGGLDAHYTLNQNSSGTLTWNTVEAGYGRFGNQNLGYVDSGLAYQFGGTHGTTTVSTAIPSARQ